MRILVCGTRRAKPTPLIEAIYDEIVLVPGDVVIHGAAPGVDTKAARLAVERGADADAYPADWQRHGKAAGAIRNQRMLDQGKPELVVALPDSRSIGTLDMVERARQRLGADRVIVRPTDFTEPGAFPVKDREGYPLGVDSFVRVVQPGLVAGRLLEYRGLVKRVAFDLKGSVITIREWYGRFTGRENAARAEHCTVERAPKELRAQEASRARRQAAQAVPPPGAARPVRAVRRKGPAG
jgi:hypothetical protein